MSRFLCVYSCVSSNQSQKLCTLTLGVFVTLRTGTSVPVRAEEVEMKPSRRCCVALPAIVLIPHCQH